MRRFNFFTYLLLLSTIIAFGQTDCLELKSELIKKNDIITNQKVEINKKDKEIQYYKETLDLLNSKISTDDKDVTFKINSVVGNLDTGKIFIEGILINNGVLRSIQGQVARAFDPKANGLVSYNISVANETLIEHLLTDVPMKFTVEFENMVTGTPVITALSIDFDSNVGLFPDAINIVFKNLNVEWK